MAMGIAVIVAGVAEIADWIRVRGHDVDVFGYIVVLLGSGIIAFGVWALITTHRQLSEPPQKKRVVVRLFIPRLRVC